MRNWSFALPVPGANLASSPKNSRKASRTPFARAAAANARSVSAMAASAAGIAGSGCGDVVTATPRNTASRIRVTTRPSRVTSGKRPWHFNRVERLGELGARRRHRVRSSVTVGHTVKLTLLGVRWRRVGGRARPFHRGRARRGGVKRPPSGRRAGSRPYGCRRGCRISTCTTHGCHGSDRGVEGGITRNETPPNNNRRVR